jgi:hypothetical protein
MASLEERLVIENTSVVLGTARIDFVREVLAIILFLKQNDSSQTWLLDFMPAMPWRASCWYCHVHVSWLSGWPCF